MEEGRRWRRQKRRRRRRRAEEEREEEGEEKEEEEEEETEEREKEEGEEEEETEETGLLLWLRHASSPLHLVGFGLAGCLRAALRRGGACERGVSWRRSPCVC